MLRICENTEACGAQAALGLVDDTCGRCPQLEFICPASGLYSVLSSSYVPGAPFVCTLN
jgi:hypothetical protein